MKDSASRVYKSWLNARVNVLFYFLTLFVSFFSRKIFLENLGAEFIGLTGTVSNILGYLNLSELGIGLSVSFFLYKPIEEHDKHKIVEIISVLGYFYSRIGYFISIIGIFVSMFFPVIFRNNHIGLGIVYFSYYCFLGSSLIGYFINYRQILLSADQKNYVVTAYFQTAGIIKTLIQILLAYIYKNLFLWVSIELLFGLVSCLILNWKINRVYPWLRTSIAIGKIGVNKYPDILKRTKQIFIHNIKDFMLTKSDEIFVFAFVSLKMVAFYGNYTMIVNKLLTLVTSVLDGIGAGVGNLVAENDKDKSIKVFWELISLRYFIAGCVVFSLYQLINPFVSLWLGHQYLLKNTVVVLLLINLFISETRGVVDMFNHAYGNYADVWAAWSELIINIAITVSVGYLYGIIGILLGKIISTFLLIVLWKPFYLFSKGFIIPIFEYWKGVIPYYIVISISILLSVYIVNLLQIDPYKNFVNWSYYAAVNISVYLVIFIPLLSFCKGSSNLWRRFLCRINK